MQEIENINLINLVFKTDGQFQKDILRLFLKKILEKERNCFRLRVEGEFQVVQALFQQETIFFANEVYIRYLSFEFNSKSLLVGEKTKGISPRNDNFIHGFSFKN